MLPGQMNQQAQGRIGNYMRLSTGGKYWPFDPRPEDIEIEAIAHMLATRGRWAGATQHRLYVDRIHYSVAEHSVYVSLYVEHELNQPGFALEALLHDASEHTNGDLIRPLKYSPEFREPFKRVEDLNERVIAEAFNLVYPWPKAVKIADEAVCEAESQQIIPRHEAAEGQNLHDASRCAPYEIQMLHPYEAKQAFLARYAELAVVRNNYRALPAIFHV